MPLWTAILAVLTRQQVTPNGDVVSKVDQTTSTGVAAGPAADLPNGTPVQPPRDADLGG